MIRDSGKMENKNIYLDNQVGGVGLKGIYAMISIWQKEFMI